MSKIFYDDYISLKKVNKLIKNSQVTVEEKEEMWRIVDEIVHHRVLSVILDNLDAEYHTEFIEKFRESPHDPGLYDFINERIEDDFAELLGSEVKLLENEILSSLLSDD